uniref:Zinc finger, CCHC-type n=1 Tax=Tanacetum cinerariifolium TaxID=118510 RepID=A0A6L2J343_TANCI|nr:zinc finger, CCHC-type [Tanacetum cinerariifolium]
MQSCDIAFWKEAIHDEISSIIGNDMWALSDLPPGCKPLGIDKFKAGLIKCENKGIVITQSHYIEKILKKFNREDCSLVSTPMNPVEKLKPNIAKPVDQLEYSRAIGHLMYDMTSTRPDIAYVIGRLSSIKEYPRTYNEAMQSHDIAFWKEAIHDEIGSIIGNDMWALSDLPPVCKPLGINKFKAGLQPEGFVMLGNEHKVCKLVKSLYGLKQAHKKWHQKFDDVLLSSGFHLNQSDKCIYSNFNNFGERVIICLYVDDMLIFGTDQNQVDKTKKFLSSRLSMKDMGEADLILGIKIKCENKGIVITQSHYIEKILKKFNREDCSSVSTPMNPVEKLKPNTAKPVDQLEYSRAIGCLICYDKY